MSRAACTWSALPVSLAPRRFCSGAYPSMVFNIAEVIYGHGPWRSFEAVEFATLEWVDWFTTTRGSWSPSETSRRPKLRNPTTPCWSSQPWRRDSNKMDSAKPSAVQLPFIVFRWFGLIRTAIRTGNPRSNGAVSDQVGTNTCKPILPAILCKKTFAESSQTTSSRLSDFTREGDHRCHGLLVQDRSLAHQAFSGVDAHEQN